MYRCEFCYQQQEPGTPSTNIVVTTRPKEYEPRPRANDPGGQGHEIVKEKLACPPCAETFAATQEDN